MISRQGIESSGIGANGTCHGDFRQERSGAGDPALPPDSHLAALGAVSEVREAMMDALLIEDCAAQRLRLRRLLEAKPDVSVTACADPASALVEAQTRAFDLVMVACRMPAMDGIALIRCMRTIPHYAQVPMVMVTDALSDSARLAALEAGATDFLDTSVRGLELTVRLRNMIRLAKAVRRLAEQAAWLDGEVEAALRRMREREEEIIFRLALAVEYRDTDTGNHTWRVARYSQIVAEELGLSPDFCRNLYLAAPLHDVGKVGVPDSILLKPGRLDPDEIALVRTHTTIGQHILGGSASELIRLAAEIAACHHERWDGGGYPKGLSGTTIPLAARIVAVADVFDALTTQRPYKTAMPFAEALDSLRAESGHHLDPDCVAAFCNRWAEIRIAGGQERTAIRPVTEPWARVPTLLREIAAEPPAPSGWLVRDPHSLIAPRDVPQDAQDQLPNEERDDAAVNPPSAAPLIWDTQKLRRKPRHESTVDDAAGDRTSPPHSPGRGPAPGRRDGLSQGVPHGRNGLPHLIAARPDDPALGRS
jgi:putative two-component system response regulator